MTATKYMCISKSAEQTTLHYLKSQPMFSEALQMEWHKPFDFPTVIIFWFSHVNGMYKFPGAHILSSWSMESLCLLSSQHKSSIHLQQLLLLTCTNFS